MKPTSIIINTLLLVAPLVSAAPTGSSKQERTSKNPERSLEYILNCSSETYTYFCGHHGTTCWGRRVMGSQPCVAACECSPMNVCTLSTCGTPYSGHLDEDAHAEEGDGNDVASTSSSTSDASTGGSSVPAV
ncbi:uncharacterized protein BO88DRAFT_417400 [Aspergillus vadensis CBS 113365]|uniref:Uncharacterized protein n=1 Tax=Aspergillus vadensis (strain CBS 113365 / IMI 142717 / IBT 24658) TaxID=1448311 RepID=A0A319B411_ASPVC|nr:hypothetical protein BO88DRAFT_417400 [Aspergillus vadensis CBS 113365]PYH66561.1 hypothetical protein BO88DRAFT_417400 [Aspergillus vadensis CBS 113365]